MDDFSSIAESANAFFNDYGMPVGMIAQAGGTLARRRAYEKIRREQEKRRQEEAERQRGIQARIDAEQASLLPKFTAEATEAQRQGIAQQYEQYMAPQMQATSAGEYTGAFQGAPTEVKERAERSLAEARAKGAANNKAVANLASYQGLDVAQRPVLNDSKRTTANLVDASRASANLLPYDLERAKLAGKNLLTTSDIANGLGSIAFLYGATAPRVAPTPAAQTPRVPGSGLNVRLYDDGPREPGLNPRARGGSPGLRLY